MDLLSMLLSLVGVAILIAVIVSNNPALKNVLIFFKLNQSLCFLHMLQLQLPPPAVTFYDKSSFWNNTCFLIIIMKKRGYLSIAFYRCISCKINANVHLGGGVLIIG